MMRTMKMMIKEKDSLKSDMQAVSSSSVSVHGRHSNCYTNQTSQTNSQHFK